MNLYLPRRHRRNLLFPPGLLALAWLLWLGCVAIEPWSEQLKPRYAVRVTMPIRPRMEMSYPTILWTVPNPDTLLRRDLWRESTLTGNSKLDSRQHQQITEHLRAILSDTLLDGGLRVRLEPTARYANLVFLFDLMLQQNAKRYWLDITRSPTTFYVITKAYKPPDPSLIPLLDGCLLCNDVVGYTPPAPPPTPFWIRFDDAVTKFWSFAWLKFPQELKQPEWQASMWLLAAISLLSSWQIIRGGRTV